MNEITLRDNVSTINPPRSPVWDGSQERAFIETVMNQRFNFLLVFVSLIVAGAINARDLQVLQGSVLTFGAVVSFFLSLTIFRAHRKLDVLLRTLRSEVGHPVAFADSKVYRWLSMRWVIGWGVPGLCWISMMVAAYFSWHGKLSYERTAPAPSPQVIAPQTACAPPLAPKPVPSESADAKQSNDPRSVQKTPVNQR